jgi:hypothetical protein
MRSEYRATLNALPGICAGFLLAACTTATPYVGAEVGEQHPSQAQRPPAAVPAAVVAPATAVPPMVAEAPPPPAAVSYPRYGDSDDYLCNFAPPGDPRTPAACIRLRGPDAVPQPVPRYGDSDDFVCHHGQPGDPRTTEACLRLRPPEP